MYCNRLLLVGNTDQLKRFGESHWAKAAHARHIELLECSANRLALQFQTDEPPLAYIQRASLTWPVTFLLDYDAEERLVKGMAMARGGKLEHWEVSYK